MGYSRDSIMTVMKEIINESEQVKPYVVIAQPRRNLTEMPAQRLDGALGLHVDFCGYSHAFCNIGGEKVDVARNYLMELCAESEAKYMLFAGEDTVLPYDGFTKLLETAENNPNSVVSGVYYIKMSSPMVMVKTKESYIIPADVTPGRLIRNVHLIGMDAMLIPLDILRAMKRNEPDLPFCCIYCDESLPAGFIGEDNFFTYRLRKMGVDIICDTGVQCLHMDLETGRYTAHPDVDITKYYTHMPIKEQLTLTDKESIDKKYIYKTPPGSWSDGVTPSTTIS